MDDFAVFVSLLLAGTFAWVQLIIGVVLGAALVVCFCLFITVFRPLTELIQLVPLFAIVGGFAIYTLIESRPFPWRFQPMAPPAKEPRLWIPLVGAY